MFFVLPGDGAARRWSENEKQDLIPARRLPGMCKVAVAPSTFGSGELPLVDAPSKQAAPQSEIPAKYRSTATAGLSVTVKAGANPPFDVALQGAH